jgi:IstB-like ATP binding protein
MMWHDSGRSTCRAAAASTSAAWSLATILLHCTQTVLVTIGAPGRLMRLSRQAAATSAPPSWLRLFTKAGRQPGRPDAGPAAAPRHGAGRRDRFRTSGSTGTQLLFRFVAAAYEQRSLGIANHWPFDQWGRFLPEHTTAVSMLDRLLSQVTVVVTKGESFRMEEAELEEVVGSQSANPHGWGLLATSRDIDLAVDRALDRLREHPIEVLTRRQSEPRSCESMRLGQAIQLMRSLRCWR